MDPEDEFTWDALRQGQEENNYGKGYITTELAKAKEAFSLTLLKQSNSRSTLQRMMSTVHKTFRVLPEAVRNSPQSEWSEEDRNAVQFDMHYLRI